MAEKKTKAEEVKAEETPAIDLAAMQAQMAAMLAEAKAAKAEAEKLLAEAKAATGTHSGMTPEEFKAHEAYMNEYVDIMLFKDNGKYKDDVYVAVNGENCVIKRGEKVKIRRKFAEVLEHSDRQRCENAMLIEKKTKEFEAATRAHLG